MRSLLHFFRLIRLSNLLIIAATQYAVRWLVVDPFLDLLHVDLQMSEGLFFLLCLSTVIIAAAGYVINDYFDVKIDRVNKPGRIIVGRLIKRRVAMGAHIVMNFTGLILAAFVAYKIGMLKLTIIQIVSAGLLWYYSLVFKKQVLIGNIIIAFLTALVPFVAGIYELVLLRENFPEILSSFSENMSSFELFEFKNQFINNIKLIFSWVCGFSGFAFMLSLIREVIKDMEDLEGDKAYSVKTFPVVYGLKRSFYLTLIFILMTMGMVGFLQFIQLQSADYLSFLYFLVLVQVPLIFLAIKLFYSKEKKDFKLLSKLVKWIMLFGVCYAIVLKIKLTGI